MNDNDIAEIIDDAGAWMVRRTLRALDAQETQLREAAAMAGALPGEVATVWRFMRPRRPGGTSLVVDYA